MLFADRSGSSSSAALLRYVGYQTDNHPVLFEDEGGGLSLSLEFDVVFLETKGVLFCGAAFSLSPVSCLSSCKVTSVKEAGDDLSKN